MRFLSVLVLLIILVHESCPVKNPFNFRKKILNQFNGARRIIASGDVAKIANVLKAVVPLLGELFGADAFGPAADMYKMVWNRQLEQAAFEFEKENGKNMGKFGSNFHHKDYIGFHWMGDFLTYVGTLMKFLPEKLEKAAGDWLDVIEQIIIVIWMAISTPKKFPIAEGAEFGAAEALYATRFEIGCYSNIAIAICFLKKVPYQERIFTPGAACSSCPTHCEFFSNSEGMREDGELCVPPKGYYLDQQAEWKALESSSAEAKILLTFLCVIVYFNRR